jgi:hypothetical protein
MAQPLQEATLLRLRLSLHIANKCLVALACLFRPDE